MKNLSRLLQTYSRQQPFKVGWYFKNLSTGQELGLHSDKIFSVGSVRKIFILMAAMKAVHDKKIRMDQLLKVEKRYQKNRSGIFQHLTPGFSITFRDALVMMITVSDNTCTGMVVDLLGLSYINQYIKWLGFTKTKVVRKFPPLGKESLKKYEDTSTPYEVTRLLDLIVQGSRDEKSAKLLGCTPVLCELALDIMSWQKFNNKLPARLPVYTKIAHKTGSRKGVINDAGVIYRDGMPLFILSVFTAKIPAQVKGHPNGQQAATQFIGELCRLCWDNIS